MFLSSSSFFSPRTPILGGRLATCSMETKIYKYKQHRNSLAVDCLCTATAVRPSIAEQMTALEQLNRQLQIKYPCRYWLNTVLLLVRERSALSDPYCHSAWMSVCLCVRNFEVKYLGNERARG